MLPLKKGEGYFPYMREVLNNTYDYVLSLGFPGRYSMKLGHNRKLKLEHTIGICAIRLDSIEPCTSLGMRERRR